MEILLETIQELAPDQASLNAAKKLLKPAKWPVLGQASSINTIWGECQGSGSKPYYTVADVSDHGYKCTCPSRKFPCKHVLALLWQFSDAGSSFTEAESPQWVVDWLGRRRRNSSVSVTDDENKVKVKKDINLSEEVVKPLSGEEVAKKEAAQAKRAAQNKIKTDTAISDGLIEFQQWLDDQLVSGISTFIKEINERCRRIASRLVDAKATNFAARIDELPAKILPLSAMEQPEAVYLELGKLALLSEAWLTNNDDVDIRRTISTAENREQVLSNPDSIRIKGTWETVGERIESRKDGLIAHSKWLINLDDEKSPIALLLDFYPAATGRKELISSIGRRLEAELIFYPARIPMRAVLNEYKVINIPDSKCALPEGDYVADYHKQLSVYPWLERFPCLLGRGTVLKDKQGGYWWSSDKSELTIALQNNDINPVLLGSKLESSFVVSDGDKAELMSAKAMHWGTVAC